MFSAGFRLSILITVMLGCLCSCDKLSQAQASAHIKISKPPEYILATLEAGIDLPEDHPNINKFRTLLDKVAAKCINNRKEISDIIIEVQGILVKKGIDVGTYDLLSRINNSIPEDDLKKYNFKQIASAFHGLEVN